MLVYTCTQGDVGTAQSFAGATYPTCETGGAWVQVEAYSGTEFDPATFDQTKAAEAYGAGFAVAGIGLAIAWSVAVVVNRLTRRG